MKIILANPDSGSQTGQLSIKEMKLYSGVGRVHAALRHLGYPDNSPIPLRVLTPLDQLHYHGTDAVDAAIAATKLSSQSRVLDIGSGYGGPARWIACQTGAHVDAIELQPDLHAAAADLTSRTGLTNSVSHIEGDVLQTPLESGLYDAIVSFLTLYHIPSRDSLFPALCKALQRRGCFYAEDLYQARPPTASESAELKGMLAAGTLPTKEEYITELKNAGFIDIEFVDVTEDWALFTKERLDAFRAGKDGFLKVHTQDVFDDLERFYDVIAGLLKAGNLGGVRCVARTSA